MKSRGKEYAVICGINIFYVLIIYNFLGGVSSISLFYLNSYRWIGLPMWIIYIFVQCLVLKMGCEKNRKHVIHALILTFCFMLLKLGIDFIWEQIAWKGQTYRQIAIVEGILPYMYEILLVLILFFFLGREKISRIWKRIKVPGILLTLSVTAYIIFIINNFLQYSRVAERYSDLFDLEQIDLYFAMLIMRGNPWFYAAFAIILWWFMRRLTDPAESRQEMKKAGTFHFVQQKTQKEKELTVLISTSNDMEAEMIADILKEKGISTVIRDRESGGAMRIYMGNSIYEKEILVKSQEYEQAKCLVEETYGDMKGEDMPEYEELSEIRRIQKRTFLVLTAAVFIIFVLIALAAM